MLRMIGILTAGAVILSASASWAQSQEVSAVDLLEKWTAALGGSDRLARIETLYSTWKVSAAGLDGAVTEWSTRRGEAREELNLAGLYHTVTVFNGESGWLLDHNGKVNEIQGADLKIRVTTAYFATFSHLLKGRRAGVVTYLGRDDAGLHRLEIKPEGGKPITVFLDSTTFLPARQERQDDDRVETTYVSGWKAVEGVMWPHSLHVTTGNPQYDSRLQLEEVRINAEPPTDAFLPPQEGAKDYRFTTGNTALGIPFELNSNHIYMQARVNGGRALWFIFDTGAGVTVLDRALAESLGLPLQGQIEGRGAGESTVAVALIPQASYTLPGVELVEQTIMAIPLGMVSPYEGRPVDGILGYDLISRFVVRIDYAAGRLDLLDPASFSYSGAGERVPLTMQDNHPHVQAELTVGEHAPVKAFLLIDTGARSALSLSRPFCEQHKLTDAVTTIQGGFGAGVGGETRERIGRVARLKLGEQMLTQVVTGFSEDQKGAGASQDANGIIGGDLLRRFTVTFDYSRHEMILEPNAHVTQPFEYDMCGAFLRTTAADFTGIEIHRIVAESPAASAGLQEGDLIRAIDDQPATELTLEEVRRMFLEPGKTYRIGYERGGKAGEASLTTRRLI